MTRAKQRPDLATLMTARDAAQLLGCHHTHVRYLANRHGIGQQLGRVWFFTPAQVEELRRIREANPPGYH